MRIATGTYTGNGDIQSFDVGFPLESIIIASSSKSMWWNREVWTERTNSFNAQLSAKLAVSVDHNTVYVGSSADVNANATVYYWIAYANADGEQTIESQNYMGNGLAARIVLLYKQAQPDAVFVKRDTARPMMIKALSSAWTMQSTGAAASNTLYINSLNVGSFTVDAQPHVNELSGDKGEACQFSAVFNGANCKVITWTGDGTSNRAIAGGVGTIKAALGWHEQGAQSLSVKIDTMASTASFSCNDGTLRTSQMVFTGSNLVVSGAMNTNALVYFALVFGPDDAGTISTAPKVLTCVPGSGRKAVYLPGRAVTSYIDCGNSDTLKLATDAPYSIELLVRTAYWNSQFGSAKDNCPLFIRSDGTLATANNTSFGVILVHATDDTSSQGLSGPMYYPIVTYNALLIDNNPPTSARLLWRTGILTPPGYRWEHIILSHNGVGLWKMYRNGKLTKQRDIDMQTNNGGLGAKPNTYGGTGHRTMFGARWTGGAPTGPYLRMWLALARLYGVALTDAQALTRYQKAALGMAGTDITPLEEWDAANASGAGLPATINSANNGTITGGSVVTL